MSLLEVLPVDSSAELFNGAALVHNACRRVLLQDVQQQSGQQEGPKVVGSQGDLQSLADRGMKKSRREVSQGKHIGSNMGLSYIVWKGWRTHTPR